MRRIVIRWWIFHRLAYIEGGISASGNVEIHETNIVNRFNYFTVSEQCWGVGGDFGKTVMMYSQFPTNTSIRFMPIADICKYPVSVYYLPISKCIIKMEAELKDSNIGTSKYQFYSDGYIDDENKIISIVALLSFIALIAATIITIKKKRRIN